MAIPAMLQAAAERGLKWDNLHFQPSLTRGISSCPTRWVHPRYVLLDQVTESSLPPKLFGVQSVKSHACWRLKSLSSRKHRHTRFIGAAGGKEGREHANLIPDSVCHSNYYCGIRRVTFDPTLKPLRGLFYCLQTVNKPLSAISRQTN